MATHTLTKSIKTRDADADGQVGWNHRVIRTQQADGSVLLAIHEVHYDGAGRPMSSVEEPVIVDGVCASELAGMLESMRRALALPVLSATDFPDEESPAIEMGHNVLQFPRDRASARIH